MSETIEQKIVLRRCSVCDGIGHDRRICPFGSPRDDLRKDKKIQRSKNLIQTSFFLPKPVKEVVNQIMEKGFFRTRSEFYRYCVHQEIKNWVNPKDLLEKEV